MVFSSLKLLILDVDGVLTDGGLLFSPSREPILRFHVQDGSAIHRWRQAGGQVAVLSGRNSEALSARLAELDIAWVHAGVRDKLAGYETILRQAPCSDSCVVYVGDDLPDLAPMTCAGWAVAVANAAPSIKRVADYVTRRPGGAGAVAEVVEYILRKQKPIPPGVA